MKRRGFIGNLAGLGVATLGVYFRLMGQTNPQAYYDFAKQNDAKIVGVIEQ